MKFIFNNETAKRIVVSLLAFLGPILYAVVVRTTEPNETLDSVLFYVALLPAVVAAGAVVVASVRLRRSQLGNAKAVIQPPHELMIFVLSVGVLLMSGGWWFMVNGGPSLWVLFNDVGLLIFLVVMFGFMLVLNRGHALRWLYGNANDSKVRLNHHWKAGAAYSLSGVLCTGIGIVAILTQVDDFSLLMVVIRVCALTSIYALVFVLHHSFCRVWVSVHSAEEHPNMPDMGSGLLSYLTGISSAVIIYTMVLIKVPEIGLFVSEAFTAFSNVLFFQPTSAEQVMVDEFGSLGWLLLIGLACSVGLCVVSLVLLNRREQAVRKISIANWIEVLYNAGLLFFLVAFCMLIRPDDLVLSMYALFYLIFVSALFLLLVFFVQVFLNVRGKWENYGISQPNLGSPSLLNFAFAIYLFMFATTLAISWNGNNWNPAFILLAVIVICGVLWSRFKRSRLESIIAKQTDKINQDKRALEALDRQKTHFFQTISHELRTPLTLIMNPLAQRLQVEPATSSSE